MKRKKLGQLDKVELESLILANDAVYRQEVLLDLIKKGRNDLWRAIANKYKLGDVYECDLKTGTIWSEKK